jgi:glycosyltransferase involved in cell wall biosynthesis
MGIQAGDGILATTDADDFVEAILKITTNEDLWIQTSNRGFSSISESYSLERGVSLLEQIVPRAAAGIAK